MRTSPARLVAALAAAALAALVPAGPAGAGASHTISASPTDPKPGDTVTVTGTTDCASSAYTVTLTYTDPEGNLQTVTATGTTDASGEYTQAVTVPETAVAEEPASVQSNIATCGEGGAAAASNTVALTITAHEGTLTVNPNSGPTGTTVQISGTNCYGGDVVVAFVDSEGDGFEEVPGITLHPDRTFSGTWQITDEAGPGTYFFVAECPGTDFNAERFDVTASNRPRHPTPTPVAPPAVPIPGTVRFTG